MDRTHVLALEIPEHVNRIADDIEKTPFDLIASGHGYRMAEVAHLDTATDTVGALHGDTTHYVLANVLLHFEDQLLAIVTLHLESRIDRGNILFPSFKRDVDHRTNHLGHRT